MPVTIVIEDENPSINYVGRWEAISSSKGSNNTLHATWAVGSQVIFKFKGSSISVFGSLRPGTADTPTAAFSIDESVAEILKGKASEVDLKQQLYTSPELDGSKQHTLVIIVTDMVGKGNAFWLDYFQVTQEAVADNSPDTPNIPPQTNNLTKIPASLPTQSATRTEMTAVTQSSTQNAASRSKSATIGIAMGSIVGGLLLLFVLIVLFFLRRKRKDMASSRRARAFSLTVEPRDVTSVVLMSRVISGRQEPGPSFIIRSRLSKEKTANQGNPQLNGQNNGNVEPLPAYQSDFGGP